MSNDLFSKKIKNKRVLLGWSALKLAKVTGIDYSIVRKIENDTASSVKYCWELAEALKIQFKKESFAKLIEDKRVILGLSKKELARLAGTSSTVIYWLEKGKTPSTKSCYKIAKALDIKLDEIGSCFQ
jgi:transcriptional regulator with XRE-family HTH domain